MSSKKPKFLSRVEKYRQDPTLQNRSRLVARILDDIKADPQNKEFRKIISLAKIQILDLGRLDRREKRRRVLAALRGYATQIDEISEETRLEPCDVRHVLKLFIRARLVVVKIRPNFLSQGTHGTPLFFLTEALDPQTPQGTRPDSKSLSLQKSGKNRPAKKI